MNDAIIKINESMKNLEEKRVPAEPIVKYLIGRLENDEILAAQIMQEHKTVQKCFDFVYKQAHKHLDGKSGWIDDDEVFQMAVDYFQMDDAELEREKAIEEAKRAEERKRQQEEAQRLRDQRKAEADVVAAQKTLDKKQVQGQLSLFE